MSAAARTGLKLGGVFKDLNDRAEAAEERAATAMTNLNACARERDELLLKLEQVQASFRLTASSLTHVETSNLQSAQIISLVRKEKSELEVRAKALLGHNALLEETVKQQGLELEQKEDALQASADREEQLEVALYSEKADNARLREQLQQRDACIASLNAKVAQRDEQITVLNHSLDTKARQLQGLIRDRDRTKDALDTLKKKVAPHLRTSSTTASSSSTSSSSSSPNSSSLSIPAAAVSTCALSSEEQALVSACLVGKENEHTPNAQVTTTAAATPLEWLKEGDQSTTKFDLKQKTFSAIIRKQQKELLALRSQTGVVGEKKRPSSSQAASSSSSFSSANSATRSVAGRGLR